MFKTTESWSVILFSQTEKELDLQLFKLFHNEKDIDELTEELNKKTRQQDKENSRREKIEDEIREKKKEQGKLTRELAKIEQQIKESVSSDWFINVLVGCD